MLDWLTGSSRPSDARYAQAEEGQSYLEEPETPAPLFAVRAFKTAIFGTPHISDREPKRLTQALEKARAITDQARSEQLESRDTMNENIAPSQKLAAKPKLDPFSSPAKGILLTPGTAATRRKTVSFLHIGESRLEEVAEPVVEDADSNIDPALTPPKKESEVPTLEQPRQTRLTERLIELSKQKIVSKSKSLDLDVQPARCGKTPTHAFEMDSLDDTPDITIDLDQPRSRSGKHWKTEYEQYHRRSSREIKQVIRYGQNVKSYALKKDLEATSLAEKLDKALANVVRMEKRVTKLTAHLHAAQSQGPEGETEQQRLIGELAQQTASAIRYKQKADQYKMAIQDQHRDKGRDVDRDGPEAGSNEVQQPQGSPNQRDPLDASSNTFHLQAQLEDLRRTSKMAEEHAKQLERENKALKRNLQRVKEEMTSYETRRHAREENLRKREEKHKAMRKECEKKLVQLTIEHQGLLQNGNKHSKPDEVIEIRTNQSSSSRHSPRANPRPPETLNSELNEASIPASGAEPHTSKPSPSPRKRKPHNNPVDIWTLNSPNNDAATTHDPFPETTLLPPSSVRHDIHRTLKEINQNLNTTQQPEPDPKPKQPRPLLNLKAHSPLKTLALETKELMQTRNSDIHSPRPKIINFQPDPAQLQRSGRLELPDVGRLRATVGRSASLMSGGGVGGTSTMGSVRGAALPAERAAAAKARLARRSAEKRRLVSA